MNATEDKVFDLNLSERYIPKWGAWEVGREIISNAIDADPEYTVEEHGPDTLRVYTRTSPTIAQMKVIGYGTKTGQTGTIGQFGEGFKLAALAAARAGGKITVLNGEFAVSFYLEGEDGNRILHMAAKLRPIDFTGCEVWIHYPGICEAVRGKFLTGAKHGPIEKASPNVIHFYMRGVHVQANEGRSIFDWNINNVEINRDRSIVDLYTIKMRVVEWMNANMTDDLARKIINAAPGSFELEAMQNYHWYVDRAAKATLLAVIQEKYGTNIVLAVEDAIANKMAAAKGKKVLVLDQGIVKVMRQSKEGEEATIPDAEQMVKTGKALVHVPVKEEWRPMMEEINRIIDLLEIPAEVFVFEHYANAELGLAVLRPSKDGCTVWINERLFLPGYRRERVSTVIHELCHIRDRGDDGTLEFEKTLDNVAGILALAWLDK